MRWSILLVALVVSACVVEDDPPRRAAAAPDSLRTDSVGGAVAGDTAATGDSAAGAASGASAVRLLTEDPARGEVLVALVEGAATDEPRCLWDGERIPCRRGERGIEVIVPLPLEGEARRFSLVVDTTGGMVTRDVAVRAARRGRELVFLDAENWRRVQRRAEVARDARRMQRILRASQPERLWAGEWREPVESRKPASAFGVERFYFAASDSERAVSVPADASAEARFGEDTATGVWRGTPSWHHAGSDYAVARGTAIRAPARGVVSEVGTYLLTGRTVVLDHGDGVMSAYFHLDSATVRRGDEVAAGRAIGRVGSTGLSTGPHLHYGVYVRGTPVDPASWHRATRQLARDSTAR